MSRFRQSQKILDFAAFGPCRQSPSVQTLAIREF